MEPDVRVCGDVNELSRQAAEAAVRTIDDAVRRHHTCSLVLSGGSTPRTLYALLASEFRDQVPWDHVHVFWGDERYVPVQDPNSNYRMARDTLLDHVPCPARNVHPMPTSFPSPDAAAQEYERTLREYFDGDWPHFDLVLLGLGEEGHIASLFPGSAALEESTQWVVAVTAPANPPERLTLTLPALTHATNIWVLATGSKKAGALNHVLTGMPDPIVYPAAGLRSTKRTLIWWIDQAAAGQEPSVATPRRGDRADPGSGPE